MSETIISLNNPVPEFSCVTDSEQLFRLSDYRGRNLVIYFYPKDNTPGCTTESIGFAEHYQEFLALNTAIVGVSRDSVASHQKFICKYNLPFPLLSDEDEAVCLLFDVIKRKNMYGKLLRGLERSTFLIDQNGVLRQSWRNVKVTDHVTKVLATVKELA